MAGVERDVAGVDGACRLERGLDFCQGTTSLHLSSQEFRIVRTVDVHLEIGFVGQNTGLPVLFKVLGATMRTVCTSMVSRPNEMMSSIPSTMVRPLHESGTPAGPSLTGIRPLPRNTPKGHHMIIPFCWLSAFAAALDAFQG